LFQNLFFFSGTLMNPTFTNFYSHIMLWICRHDGLHTVTFLLVDQNMNNDPRHRKVGITRNLALQISKLGGFILYGAFIMSNYDNSFTVCKPSCLQIHSII
jgi:hypothetical protein